MSLWSLLTVVLLALAGCKNPAIPSHGLATVNSDPLSYQIGNLGIARIRSTYSLASGSFQSTCSGVLLHSGDKAVSECVVLSAASCFKHIPRIAEHSIEFFDPDGRSSKLFRAHDILIHPDFDAADAQLSLSESAFDLALVKFNCTLPVSVRSVRIADFDQVPVNGKLIAVHSGSRNNESESMQPTRSQVRIESIDFPVQRTAHENSTEPPGVLTLRNTTGELECVGNPGSPVFFQSGRELLLIANLSMPATDCFRSTHRYTLLSPHIKWMKKVLGTGAVSYEDRLTNELIENTQITVPPKPSETVIAQVSPTEKPQPLPLDIPLTLPRASAIVRNAAQKAPKKLTAPTVTLRAQKNAQPPSDPKKKKSAAPPERMQTQTPTPDVPQEQTELQTRDSDSGVTESSIEIQPFQDRIDIPPPTPQNQCVGRRMVANSKTRVWGTVIKLIDRPSNEILDERMKCDIPNEVEICLNSDQSLASSGHVAAQLLLDIELGGCERFKSGETVYFLKTDFISY